MAMMVKVALFVLLLTTVLDDRASAFILDSQSCLAYPPCTCSGTIVICNNKHLTTVPNFYPSNVTGSYIYFLLNSNNFTSIPADSFSNLTVSNNTKICLKLQSSHINSIDRNAFRGIRDTKLDINLNNNNLKDLPSELATLTNVEALYIQTNPISSVDINTMHQLGETLKTFSIGLNHYNGMPVELNQLKSLENLYIRYLNSTHLDYDVFDGLANSLTTLSIQYSQLETIPVAIRHLHNLQSLTFSYNNNLHTNHMVLERCGSNLTSVTSVNLNNNNLRYIPDVFRSFPSMTTLNLRNNKLSYIHWDSVPSNSPLTQLYLENNDFTRIPSVVGKLHSLRYLYLSGNEIKSVEDPDLSNLQKLYYINLGNNPIEYISPHAFKNNLALRTIYLRTTNLSHLPSSLSGLSSLRNLYLYNTPLQCDCDLSFMEAMDIAHMYIYGTCKYSTTSIKTYLMDGLQRCH